MRGAATPAAIAWRRPLSPRPARRCSAGSSLTFTATGNPQVWATGFYSDGTSATLSDVTWTCSISNAHVSTSSSGESFLFLDSIPSGVTSFTLTATQAGESATRTVSIVQ